VCPEPCPELSGCEPLLAELRFPNLAAAGGDALQTPHSEYVFEALRSGASGLVRPGWVG
jgi:hypothetical protein